MACRYTYQGKTYEAHEFDDVLRAMAPSEASKYMTGVESIPSAPMTGDTKSWTALALKRMIVFAVHNRFDSIAWTTGEQQAARYDLSKQVMHIDWEKNEDGTFNINTPSLSGETIYEEDLSLSDLEETLGKDVAHKIVEGVGDKQPKDGYREWKRLSGANLSVGNQGMKGYYDAIVPQVANDILKKFGGKVESVEFGDENTESKYVIDAEDVGADGNKEQEVIVRDRNTLDGVHAPFNSINAAEAWLDKNDMDVGVSVQQGFTITPEMRSKIQNEGLPLFSLSQIEEQKSLSVELIKDEVAKLMSKWPSAPEITIVQSSSEIPFGVPLNSDGVLHEGKAYLIADNIGTVAQIQKVLAHECVLHHSLLDMLGEYGFAKLHNGVQSLKASGDKTVVGLSQAVAQQYGPLTPEDETKEIVAKAGERCIDAEGNIKIQYAFMKEVYAGVANFMRDKGFQIPFTNIELQGIISNAGKWIARDRGVDSSVSSGHFIGKVLSISNGIVSQKVGREPGQVVSHDASKLNAKPIVGQLAEIRYQDGKGHVMDRSQAPSMQR